MTTDLTAARALAESLYDSGDLSIDQAGPILAALDEALALRVDHEGALPKLAEIERRIVILLAERDGLREALIDAVSLLSVPEHAWDDEHEMRRDALEAMLETTTTAPPSS